MALQMALRPTCSPVAGIGRCARLGMASKRLSRGQTQVARVFGGPEDQGPKKALKREEEPEEYWTSAAERKGQNPFKDPLAQIGILSILFPFLLLGVFIALGVVDVSGGR